MRIASSERTTSASLTRGSVSAWLLLRKRLVIRLETADASSAASSGATRTSIETALMSDASLGVRSSMATTRVTHRPAGSFSFTLAAKSSAEDSMVISMNSSRLSHPVRNGGPNDMRICGWKPSLQATGKPAAANARSKMRTTSLWDVKRTVPSFSNWILIFARCAAHPRVVIQATRAGGAQSEPYRRTRAGNSSKNRQATAESSSTDLLRPDAIGTGYSPLKHALQKRSGSSTTELRSAIVKYSRLSTPRYWRIWSTGIDDAINSPRDGISIP